MKRTKLEVEAETTASKVLVNTIFVELQLWRRRHSAEEAQSANAGGLQSTPSQQAKTHPDNARRNTPDTLDVTPLNFNIAFFLSGQSDGVNLCRVEREAKRDVATQSKKVKRIISSHYWR